MRNVKFAVQQDFLYICVYYTSREFPIIPHVNFPYKTSMDDLELKVAKSCASVDNYIPLDDIFDYKPKKNVIFILLYRTLDPLFSTVLGLPC